MYKITRIFTWFLELFRHRFSATVRWGASSWQHHQRHRNLSPPTLLPSVVENGHLRCGIPSRCPSCGCLTLGKVEGSKGVTWYCWWFRNPVFTSWSSEMVRLNGDTVDGSAIRLSSWGTGSLSHDLQGFYTSQVVVWDFWTINNIHLKKSPVILDTSYYKWWFGNFFGGRHINMSPGKGPFSKEMTSSSHPFSGMFISREFSLPKTKITSEKWWLAWNLQEMIQFWLIFLKLSWDHHRNTFR